MHNYQLISQILSGYWALDPNWANAQIPLVVSLLDGKPVNNGTPMSFVDRTGNQGVERPFAVDASTGERQPFEIWDHRSYSYIPNPNLQKGAVGVLPISSAITKYNVECGAPGMIERDGWLRSFIKNDQISAIILLMDTPGGEVRAADTFAQTIQNSPKPIVTYIDGMCCSLGMWFASASDKTFFSSKNGELGSIGALVHFADMSGMLEKAGIKLHEIYAPQSKDKNKVFRDAKDGDYGLIESELQILVDEFINHVKAGRPEAVKSADKWNTGKVFRAEEAMKLGLADGILPFERVVSYSKFLARTKNISK